MPQSVLKKPSYVSSAIHTPPAAVSLRDHSKQTALYHAQLLQQRKDTENLIFASIENLIDLPSSPGADPGRPSPADAAFVQSALKLFRPSDYDDLIEERNIDGLCGYVLCPRPRRKQNTGARYRILKGTDEDHHGLKFVTRQSLEKWCSDTCGERALYIKVQLDDEPSWTRLDSFNPSITLLEGIQDLKHTISSAEHTITNGFDQAEAEADFIDNMKALAIERGDTEVQSIRRGFDNVNIQEKRDGNKNPLLAGYVFMDGEKLTDHGVIEGHTPKSPNELFLRESISTKSKSEEAVMRTV